MIQLNYDVIILGGGLAGLSLARQLMLSKSNLKITVIEARTAPLKEAAHKVGESLVEIGAHYFKHKLQLADHLQNEQLKKAGLRFFFTRDNASIDTRPEFGAVYLPPVPSFQLDRGRFENYLRDLVCANGVKVHTGTRVKEVILAKTVEELHCVYTNKNECLKARWVVDASGRAAILKKQLGLQKPVEHDVNAAWFRIKGKLDIDGWFSQDDSPVPEGLRYLSTTHLMGNAYWVWIIPLASENMSIGIVAENTTHDFSKINTQTKALAWLSQHEPQLANVLAKKETEFLDFHTLKHYSHACQQVFSSDRWALTGEAGVFLDPFYSPGSDFIAMSNDYIADLILSNLAKEDISLKAFLYDKSYLALFASFLKIYESQYPLMGHPQLMQQKIIWDYAVYWGFIALLYLNNKLCDINFIQDVSQIMDELASLNLKVQRGFRKQLNDGEVDCLQGFTDTLLVEPLRDWHYALLEQFDDEQLKKRLQDNLAYLRKMSQGMKEVEQII